MYPGNMNDRRWRLECENLYDDLPPYSRLFIVCNKAHGEDEFRENFGKFGTIEDLRVVKDRNSGENKGVVFIKFSRTSEAASALEEMHGKRLSDTDRPLKVMIAASKATGKRDSARDVNEDQFRRLFVVVPKTFNEDDVDKEFSKHGRVESVVIQKDRNTSESKGYAYIKFRTFRESALAYENADKKYRAIFAEPKKSTAQRNNGDHQQQQYRGEPNHGQQSGFYGNINQMIPPQGNGFNKLKVVGHPSLTEEMVWKLFDLVPGMEMAVVQHNLDSRQRLYCEGTVVYTTPGAAAYARDKLNNFEYPTGHRLMVTPKGGYNAAMTSGRDLEPFSNSRNVGVHPDFAKMAETISKYSKIIDAVTGNTLANANETLCNVSLPPAKPLASIDSAVAKRCFIVCSPQPPPAHILRDVFSRFGDLIDVYTLPHPKTVGYAKYASVEAADQAIKVLHGAEICGIRMKVLEAEERSKQTPLRREQSSDEADNSDNPNKRAKIDED